MKMELIICDIDTEKKPEYEFTVWYSLTGEVTPDSILFDSFMELSSLLDHDYITKHLNKSLCCKLEGEIIPVKYTKSDMTVQEVYDKVRGEQK